MTSSTNTINNNIISSEFFVELSGAFAQGTSTYDKIEKEAKETQRFMEYLQGSGITSKIDDDIDNYKFKYKLQSKGGHASLKGGAIDEGNPDIIVEDIKHTITGVRSEVFHWNTKFTKIDWDRNWQAIRLQNSGAPINISEIVDFEFISQHIIRGGHARNFWYINEIMNGLYTMLIDFEKDLTSPDKKKFSIQEDLFSDRPTKFRFTDLLDYEQELIDANLIKDYTSSFVYGSNFPEIQLFVYIPRTIYEFCLQDLINNNKEGQNAVLYSWIIQDEVNKSFLQGLGALGYNTMKVKAESLPKQFKLRNMMVICSSLPEDYQMFEQDVTKTKLNKKTHKIIMSLKDGFQISHPTSLHYKELTQSYKKIPITPSRGIMLTPFYGIEIEVRRREATQQNKEFDDTIFRAHGVQKMIPVRLDRAGAFEIDSALTLGISQTDLETQMLGVNSKTKKSYSKIFYNLDTTDENLPFVRPIV